MQVTDRVSATFFLCERVSFGLYERGPVGLMIESHGQFSAPDPCIQSGYDQMELVHRFYVTDPVLAEALVSLTGGPFMPFALNHSSHPGDEFTDYRWEWGLDAAAPSFIVAQAEDDSWGERERTQRYMWTDGTGLWAFNLVHRYHAPATHPFLVQGEIHEPMLYADHSPLAPYYAGPGNQMKDASIEAPLLHWDDLVCTE